MKFYLSIYLNVCRHVVDINDTMLITRKRLVLGCVQVDKTISTYQEPKIGVLECEKLGLKPNWRFYEYFKILKPKLGVL